MAKYRKLSRTSSQRKALLRNQVTALLENGKIVTTEAKAKEVRKIAEGLIALAVKEKDNFDTVTVTAKVPRKDADGKRVKEVVDGKKVTVYKVYEEKTDRLLDKANRVSDKYMKHEKKVYTQIEEARSQGKGMVVKIRNGSEFQQAIEKFPELRSNENIQLLLRQIRECENGLAGQKMTYNTCVENYNVAIHSFPFSVIRKICRFENMEYYRDREDEELISDEALGI